MSAGPGVDGRITSYRHEGLVFDVRDEGPLDGVPAILLHGFPERSTTWRAVAPLLHAQGVRTLAPDQRGYSPGARPPRRRDHRVEQLSGDVAGLAEAIGAPVHLVGHDWGAVVAWDLAARRPELVRSLVAVSVPHPAAFLRALKTSGQARRSWYMAFFQLPVLPELSARRRGGLFDGFLRRAGMRPDEIARFRDEVVADGALPGGLAWYRAMPLDRTQTGRKVRVPTTFVWSDGDVAVDRAGVDLTARYVAAPYRLVVLPGVSHWIPTHEPARLATIVLEQVRASSPGQEQP